MRKSKGKGDSRVLTAVERKPQGPRWSTGQKGWPQGRLTEAPARVLPDRGKEFELYVDVKQDHDKRILLWEHRGTLHPVAYFSKMLHPMAWRLASLSAKLCNHGFNGN